MKTSFDIGDIVYTLDYQEEKIKRFKIKRISVKKKEYFGKIICIPYYETDDPFGKSYAELKVSKTKKGLLIHLEREYELIKNIIKGK